MDAFRFLDALKVRYFKIHYFPIMSKVLKQFHGSQYAIT